MTPFTLPIPRYQCHKQVSALKISAIVDNPRGVELHFEDKRFVPIQFPVEWAVRHDPHPGGYVVWYDGDNYVSYSPAAAFEAGYTLIDGEQPGSWGSLQDASQTRLFNECRGIMGTANFGQDDALYRALMHFRKAIIEEAQQHPLLPVGPATQAAREVGK